MIMLMLMRLCMGSPPQVRGKRWALWMSIAALRITPAGAGKTRSKCNHVNAPPDHPRRCGENGRRQRTRGYYRGSPPQVRGKHGDALKEMYGKGITPAGAGKTATFVSAGSYM